MSSELWRELFDGDVGKRGADIIRRTNSLEAFSNDRNRNQFARFILDRIRVLAGETDEPVTSDVKRLIRLPGSLHGTCTPPWHGARAAALRRSTEQSRRGIASPSFSGR